MLVDLRVAEANGTAERTVALEMLEDHVAGRSGATVAGDKGYDTREFVARSRALEITPHVAQMKHSAVDARTTRHSGYTVSQRLRKRIEEIFGWGKTVGGMRKTRFRGRIRTQLANYFIGAAYNLLRIANLNALAAGTA